MKRFIAFVWMSFEQSGGWNDVFRGDDLAGSTQNGTNPAVASFDTKEEAERCIRTILENTIQQEGYSAGYGYQIVDLELREVVAKDELIPQGE